MVKIIHSLKRLAVFNVLIVIFAAITIGFFELFIAKTTNLPTFIHQVVDVALVFFFASITMYALSRSKKLLTPHLGLQLATVIQFLLMSIAIIAAIFAILGIVGEDPTTLLTSAGIISITVGLIISTFVGGLLSGALVLTTHRLKIGDSVMVNNMPGQISDMSALITRIRTDVGQITVPNSAIASGGVIVTTVLPQQPGFESRLPYSVGDRVITSFQNEQGIVTELTAYHTTVVLDSGKQITFLNNAVLTGATAIAKITRKPPPS